MASGVVKHGWATDDIIMETVTSDTITISSESSGHCTATCTKSGYTPIGMIGILKYTDVAGGQNTSYCPVYEYEVRQESGVWKAYVYFRNFANSQAKFYCKLDILYRKNA